MRWSTIVFSAVLIFALNSRAESVPDAPKPKPVHYEQWEAYMLGVTDQNKLQQIRNAAQKRMVTLAAVGMSGTSKSRLAQVLVSGNTLEYCDGASDPKKETHDTIQLRVLLKLTLELGVKVRLLVYQPNSYEGCGEAFREAEKQADLVIFYHSFWGEKVPAMMEKLRQSDKVLFLCPYAEVGPRPTSTCSQAYAAHPDGSGIPHLVTCIPLSRKTGGALIHPSCRSAELDSETINFIAPSYYAANVGATCLATGVTTAVAAYIVAASPEKPTPAQILKLMRESVTVDRALLKSKSDFNDAAVDKIQAEIDFLVKPDKTGLRRLENPGILNLWKIFTLLKAQSSGKN